MRIRPSSLSSNLVSAVLGAAVVAVLSAGTAVAVSTTAVSITNPATGVRANVTNKQSLATSARDPYSGVYGRVDAAGRQLVGDGSGALTVNGAVSSRDLDVNKLVYRSPGGGLNCGASSAGLHLGTLDLSRYSKLRFAVHSGPSNQTIIELRARGASGSEVITTPYFDWTVPANARAHTVLDAPASSSDLVVYFCATAKIYIYGIR